MGTSSRLYQILIKDKVDEDEKARKNGDFRGFPGLSTFHRLSKGIRTSFRKIRSIRTRLSRGKTFVSNKDSGYETEPRPPECDSLDSGLESDRSLDLSSTSVLRERSVNSLSKKDSSTSSVDIVRKCSNRSSRTIDSGVVSRTSPGCLVTHRIHSLPKKKVSIRLPGETGPVFGHELRVETTKVVDVDVPDVPPGQSVGRQRRLLMSEACRELVSLHPAERDTILILFGGESVDLTLLDTEAVSDLLFNLRNILYRSLRTLVHFEVTLFLVQHFLLRLTCVLGLDGFPASLEDLILKSERLSYSRHSFLLQETQTLYIELWCSLLD